MEHCRRLNEYLLSLDIFSDDVELDQTERRTGRVATRIYILIFTIILILYALFNTLTTEITAITVSNPSQSDFENLQALYSETLICPCREIAVAYRSFILITPKIHPVCTSGFVTNEWLSYMTNTVDRPSFLYVRTNCALKYPKVSRFI